MCLPHHFTVALYKDQRHFYCWLCCHTHPHPPEDLEHYCIGYGYCPLYGDWMPIVGGDGLGIVTKDVQGRRYTMLYGPDNPRPRSEGQADGEP